MKVLQLHKVGLSGKYKQFAVVQSGHKFFTVYKKEEKKNDKKTV